MATRKSTLALERQHAAKDFVMLAHKFNPKKHTLDAIKGWRIEEKFDGVRARWHEGKFFSRSMKPFPVPEAICMEFMMQYGDLPLDGEFSIGRGRFQKTVSVVRNSHSTLLDWSQVEYNVFDYYAEDRAYEDRIEYLEGIFINHPMVRITKALGYVKSLEDIHAAHRVMKANGGEGLILRNPEALYKLGRSWDLLKVKSFLDMEVLVVGHTEGEGKHDGRLGALVVTNPSNGTTFKVGTGFSDADRINPPQIGEWATIEFFEFTDDGIPRFPTFKGVRNYE